MKKTLTFTGLLLLSLVLVFSNLVNAQTRERRVGQTQSPPGPGSSSPTKAPVLRGTSDRTSSQPGPKTPEGNQGPEEVAAGDVIQVNTTLVTLPVSVTDRDGKYIPNLVKEDFRLWEDGVEQQVAFFGSVDMPFSVVLMLDTSASTRFKMEEIQDAAIAFVNQLRPDDRVMVVSFDDNIRVLADFSGDRSRLRDAIRRTKTGSGTKLYDAVDMVINKHLNHIEGRKAIVLFTDGVDTTSRHASYDRNVRDAEELDALIYPIQYDTYMDMNAGGGGSWPGTGPIVNSPVDILIGILGGGRRGGIGRGPRGGGVGQSRRDYEVANRYLRDLAYKTGARQYQADTMRNLSYAFENIAEELRRQYSLGYYPKRTPQRGERRQVRVRVNQPNLAVRTRDSYVFGRSGTQDTAAAQTQPVLQKKFGPGSGGREFD
jgi:Ca-activated chloride channel homolog